MGCSDALAVLKGHADVIRAMGATALYLYGSTARDEAGPSSDLDVFIDYDPATRFNAFDLVEIKQYLEDRLGSAVDVSTRDGLHPRLRERIEDSAIKIF